MNEQNIIDNKKYNVKLFPIYKALSWDLLFYYAISFLFLTGTKGISASDVLFYEAFYPIFKFILQIPTTIIINKFGNRKSLILGNLFVSASILLMIVANGLPILIFSQFLSALGFSLKNLTETAFLYDSIEKSEKRNDTFSKIDGRSSSFYYYIDAITSLTTGFLFVVNGYLPMLLCFLLCVIATLISFNFKEVSQNKTEKINIKENLTDIRDGFKFIFQSSRLKSLIIFYSLLTSILSLRSSLSSSIFTDIHLPEQYFGITYAIFQIISGVASSKQAWFHNKFRNRTLTVFGLGVTLSMIAIGLCEITNLNYGLSLEIILIMLAIQCAIKGPYNTLIKRYLNSFSTSSMRTKIYAAVELPYSLVRAGICFICSALLDITTTSYVYVILGCIFTVIMIFLLDHMKHTVGLKPEEYSKKDIEFVEMK